MNGKRLEILVTPPERELQWCYYSPSIFLSSSQTAPRPLSSFDTHARWQPVTQSARFRRSYGKIEDCEQSTLCRPASLCSVLHFRLSPVTNTLNDAVHVGVVSNDFGLLRVLFLPQFGRFSQCYCCNGSRRSIAN